MLYVPRGSNAFTQVFSSGSNQRPTTTAGYGHTVVANASASAYGNYIQMGNALTYDSYGMYININNYFLGGANRLGAIQIGVDYAGSTNYTPVISGLLASEANTFGTSGTGVGAGGLNYYFPLFIPAGSTVAVAARGSANAALQASATFMTQPRNPASVRRGSYVDTFGLTLGTGTVVGTNVLAGTTAPGAWTFIGATTKRYWWLQAGVQMASDITMTVGNMFLDVGVVPSGSSTGSIDVVIEDMWIGYTGTEQFSTLPYTVGAESEIPSGSAIYARLHNAINNTDGSPLGTYQVAVYACGG